jgi:hypothetical protein
MSDSIPGQLPNEHYRRTSTRRFFINVRMASPRICTEHSLRTGDSSPTT